VDRADLLFQRIYKVRRKHLIAIIISTCSLAGCATTAWNDLTGQGRGNGDLQMAEGQCEMEMQRAGYLQASRSHASGRNGAMLNAASILLAEQNAYSSCMRANGWAH